MKCECEHEFHFPDSGRLVNDPPSHIYGADFSPSRTKLVLTDYGTFRVCMDCAAVCLKDWIKA